MLQAIRQACNWPLRGHPRRFRPSASTASGSFLSHRAPTTGRKDVGGESKRALGGEAFTPPPSAAVWSRAFRLLLSGLHSCRARLLFTETRSEAKGRFLGAGFSACQR